MTNPTQSTADQSYLADLRRRFQADYSPQTAAEQVLLNEMIAAAQRLHHLNRMEEAHLQGEPDLDTLGKLSRQRTAASSIFHRSRRLLDAGKLRRLPFQPAPTCPAAVQPATEPAPRAGQALIPSAPSPAEPGTTKPTPAPRFRPHFIPKDDPSGQKGYRLTPNVIYAITEAGMAQAEAHLTTLFTAMDHWPTPPTEASLPPSPLNPARKLHPHDLLHYASQCAIPHTSRYIRADAARCYALSAPPDEPHAQTCLGIRAILCNHPDAIYDRNDLLPPPSPNPGHVPRK